MGNFINLQGRTWGRVLCLMSSTVYPKKFWHIPSFADYVIHVGLRVVFFRAPDLVMYLEKALQRQNRGMELHDARGSTLMCRGLLP